MDLYLALLKYKNTPVKEWTVAQNPDPYLTEGP